jgi:hypothetical protein
MNAKAEQVINYLQTWAEARKRFKMGGGSFIGGYESCDDFILRNGQPWRPARKPHWVRFGTIKECFCNAARLVLAHDDLIYCEGYAAGAVIPVMHAWAIDNEGTVIDNTWRTVGTEYFGVAVQRSYLHRALARQKYYGLIDAYTHRWPMLRADPKTWRHPIMDRK